MFWYLDPLEETGLLSMLYANSNYYQNVIDKA